MIERRAMAIAKNEKQYLLAQERRNSNGKTAGQEREAAEVTASFEGIVTEEGLEEGLDIGAAEGGAEDFHATEEIVPKRNAA